MNEIENKKTLNADEFQQINAYWRAANYLYKNVIDETFII